MRQINFGLIFSFDLIILFFTPKNMAPTKVQLFPSMEYTLPLAGLLLLVAGIGEVAAWLCAASTWILNNVNQFSKANELKAQQVCIQELETDFSFYLSTMETQLGLLLATTGVSSNTQTD